VAGELVEAHNAGEGAAALTVAGIFFDAAEVNPLGLTFSGANPANITGDTVFDSLLQSASFGQLSVTTTFNIDALSPGRSYLAQFFVTDSRGSPCGAPCSARVVTLSDGVNSLTSGPIGLGYAFTGTFTASGATQQVVFSGDVVPYLNAWQLRDVTAPIPEPSISAFMLVGFALIGIAAGRYKHVTRPICQS